MSYLSAFMYDGKIVLEVADETIKVRRVGSSWSFRPTRSKEIEPKYGLILEAMDGNK